MNPYELKLQAKRQRLIERAANAAQRAAGARKRHEGILEYAGTTPVLVGHHSEGRHRRDLARANTAMHREVEETKRAQTLLERADAVGTGGVSSDDPDAIAKLEAELAKLDAERERMKRLNSLHRKGGWEAVAKEIGADPAGRLARFQGGPESKPYPSYALTNASANARRIKERIAELRKLATLTDRSAIGRIGDVEAEIRLDTGENRVMVIPRGRLGKEAFKEFLRFGARVGGWRWSGTNKAFQRNISPNLFEMVCRELEAKP